MTDAIVRILGTPEFVFAVSRTFTGLCVAILSLEYLAISPEFGPDGLFSWRIFRTKFPRSSNRLIQGVNDSLFDLHGMQGVFVARACAGLVMMTPGLPLSLYGISIIAAAVLGLFVPYRTGYGGDGSDQMSTLVLFGLGLFACMPADDPFRVAGIWFIAVQAVLAYAVAGIAKAISPTWRSGDATFKIFNTGTYGLRPVATLLRDRRVLNLLLSWNVIVFECAFLFALFLPLPFLFALLLIALLFHVGNAVIMGLNTFFWAFFATYPAIIYANLHLRQTFGI